MRTNTPKRRFFHRPMSLESFTKFLCRGEIDHLRQFDICKRRHRKQGLEGFIWLGLFAAAYSYMESLASIFKQIGKLIAGGAELPVKLLSVSAFTQYRRRFPLCCLRRLWAGLVLRARSAVAEPHADWRGLCLWAMDGTGLIVPEELWPYFGAHRGCRGDGPAQAHLVVLYDLHARAPAKLRVGPFDKKKERALAPKLVRGLGAGDLLLIDGGFYSICLFAQFDRNALKFLIPMRNNAKPKRIKVLGPDDGLYEIRASKQYWKDTPGVPETMTVRIITVHRKGFRSRRLVTNLLDADAFPAQEMAAVYHERWHIETFYRELKQVLKVERWHARTVHSFYAELFFMMILATLTRLAMADAAGSRSSPGGLSFTKSLAWMRDALVISALLPIDQWPALYGRLLSEIARCKIDVRPDRQFERNRQKRRKHSRLKRLAALKEPTP